MTQFAVDPILSLFTNPRYVGKFQLIPAAALLIILSSLSTTLYILLHQTQFLSPNTRKLRLTTTNDSLIYCYSAPEGSPVSPFLAFLGFLVRYSLLINPPG